jgi:hypothetical protein
MFFDDGFKTDGLVDLNGAKLGRLIDDVDSWPRHLGLDQMTYDVLTYMPARGQIPIVRFGNY